MGAGTSSPLGAQQLSFFNDLAEARPSRRAVGEWTLKRLYESIFGGEFAPGQSLVEGELTQRLGVSRQPVREALRQLEHDGLVEPAPGNRNGQRLVVRFGREHVEEIYALRAALEELSFSRAAPLFNQAQLSHLERIQEALERKERDRTLSDRYDCSLDFRFHEFVCEVSEMKMLQAHLTSIWIRTWALLTQLDVAGTYPATQEIQDSYRDRRNLIAALRSRDSHTAAAAVRAHVSHRRDQLLAAIDDGRGTFRLGAATIHRIDTRHPAALFA